jgi:hypothetical protein
MTPKDVQTIYELLASRVVPQSAREGAAIMALAAKLVSNFAQKDEPQHASPSMVVRPTEPPVTPDPTPEPPGK